MALALIARAFRSLLGPALLGAWLLGGCVPAGRLVSGRVYPLPRHQRDDGLAVVTRPGGEGLHIWLDTDTSREGICRPRWNPDAARLRRGDGPDPVSSGRAPREEFYAALKRGQVRWALRRQMESLCRARAPRREFVWVPPPRRAADLSAETFPLVEERNLLSHPRAVRRAEKRLLGQPLTPEDFREEELPPDLPGP